MKQHSTSPTKSTFFYPSCYKCRSAVTRSARKDKAWVFHSHSIRRPLTPSDPPLVIRYKCLMQRLCLLFDVCIVSGLCVVWALLMLWFRKRIKMAIAITKEAARAVNAMKVFIDKVKHINWLIIAESHDAPRKQIESKYMFFRRFTCRC